MLTQSQAKVLEAIRRYQDEHGGVSPSFGDLERMTGISGGAGISRCLEKLEERGFIRRLHGRARAIEIIRVPAPNDRPLIAPDDPLGLGIHRGISDALPELTVIERERVLAAVVNRLAPLGITRTVSMEHESKG